MDLIAVTSDDVVQYMRKEPRHLDDVWTALLNHSLEARNSVEEVYRLDLRAHFRARTTPKRVNWSTNVRPPEPGFSGTCLHSVDREREAGAENRPINQPQNPANPKYNPAAGSAPAP